MKPFSVRLLYGTEYSLVINELDRVMRTLGHTGEQNFTYEEYSFLSGTEENPVAQTIDACRTPSLLAPEKIIVLRGLEQTNASQLEPLIEFIKSKDTAERDCTLILVSAGKKPAAALIKAVTDAGTATDTDPKSGAKGREEWYAAHLVKSHIGLEPTAVKRLKEHVGEDLTKVEEILSLLTEAYGTNTKIGLGDLEPFLGAEGSSAPWDLTDAIDAGKSGEALHQLFRLLENQRHPLQILSILWRHYQAMIRLDGLTDIDGASAAKVTKLAPYPAGKALRQSRTLGSAKLARAVQILKEADLAVKGSLGLEGRLILEIAVLRLSQLPKLKSLRRNT